MREHKNPIEPSPSKYHTNSKLRDDQEEAKQSIEMQANLSQPNLT
mgnify:CR=1 FL=1